MQTYCGKFLGSFFTTESCVSTIPCWRDTIFKGFISFYFLDYQQKLVGFLTSSFWLAFKTAFYGSRKDLWTKEIFSDKKCFFHQFLTLKWCFSGFWQKKIGRVIQTAFYVSRGTFWQNCFREKFFSSFPCCQQELLGLFDMIVKHSLYVPGRTIWANKDSRKT